MNLDVAFDLLDRQVVDVHGSLVCKVDDVELTPGPDGRLTVTAILVGPGALGPRIGDGLGRFMVGLHCRLKGTKAPAPPRIPIQLVQQIGSDVRLVVPVVEIDVRPLEDWVSEHLIGSLPGSGDA